MLSASKISYRVGASVLLEETTVNFEPGKFHVIMGANGAGKSTLLKILAGEQKPFSGHVDLFGKNLSSYSKLELASWRAVLSQHYHISFPIQVEDIVMMGRYPFFKVHPGSRDKDIISQSMKLMNVELFRNRDYNTLSGGESQKVQMSRVLAQIWDASEAAPKLLFLDEPVSHLDVKYQHQLLEAAKTLCEKHTTVIAILHDINLALSFADRILFMKKARISHDISRPDQVTTAIINDVFDINARMIQIEGHQPVVVF
jgi:iron complex transport system ATP-binding protein